MITRYCYYYYYNCYYCYYYYYYYMTKFDGYFLFNLLI